MLARYRPHLRGRFVRMGSATTRDQAIRLASSQPERAFELARSISDAWYRSQAMSEIGRVAAEPLASKAFKQARAAAAAGLDAYQRSAVLAFAIRAALDRSNESIAEEMLADALTEVPDIEPIASRAEALRLLWGTVAAPGHRTMRETIIKAACRHVHPDRSWRSRRLYRDICATIAWDRPDLANQLIRTLPEGKTRAFLERRRAQGERW